MNESTLKALNAPFANSAVASSAVANKSWLYEDITAVWIDGESSAGCCIHRDASKKKSAPTITDVKSYDNKTTVVFFSDGTKEHANCSENDTYSLEYGISVCLLKKLLGGNETYKKIVNTAAKSYREKQAAEEAEKLRKKEEHEARMKEEQESARRRKEAETRREAEETEKQINIMAEAFRRAMQQSSEVS